MLRATRSISGGSVVAGRDGVIVMETIRFDTARVVAVADVDSNRMALGKNFIEDYYTKKTGKQ